MRQFKTQEELAQWVYDMHLQNTNGRESHDEMFKLGIEACLEELRELKLFAIPVVMGRNKNKHKHKISSCCGAKIDIRKYDMGWNVICCSCKNECDITVGVTLVTLHTYNPY